MKKLKLWMETRQRCGVIDEIRYPIRISEFEVQAHIYWTLKSRGINIRGEVSSRYARCRFDLVVFDCQNKPKLIIEVKPRKPKTRSGRRNLRKQSRTYTGYQVPVVLVVGMDTAIKFCRRFDINNPIGTLAAQ